MKFNTLKSYAASLSTKLATASLTSSSSATTSTLHNSRPRKVTTSSHTKQVVFSEGVKRRLRLAQSSSPVKIRIRQVQMADPSGNKTMKRSMTTADLSLPPELARPAFRDVNREIINAIDPELADTPTAFVRDTLAIMGESIFKALKSTTTLPLQSMDAGRVPDKVDVTIPRHIELDNEGLDMIDLIPTHMLAVYASPSSANPSPRHVTLFPTHNLVLAAHCANLPALPRLTRENQAKIEPEFIRLTLPVVPLSIPSPETFAILSTYLCTRKTARLMASLLPIGPDEEDPASSRNIIDTYAEKLHASLSSQILLQCALKVHSVWKNVCSLGIYDQGLWSTLDLCWHLILRAMSMPRGEGGSQSQS